MFIPFHLKTLHPLQVFSLKPSSSSSSSALSSTKLKSLIRSLIVSRMCRLIRALSKFKAIILDIVLRDNNNNYYSKSNTGYQFTKNHCSKTQKIILGSFRLHYNWCSSKSSHAITVPTRVFQGLPTSIAGNSNNFPHDEQQQQQYQQEGDGGGGEDWPESELAGYLQWLEEKENDDDDDSDEINEIDMRAEMFIANCHEKFRLEKQESDRRFHEMLARGL